VLFGALFASFYPWIVIVYLLIIGNAAGKREIGGFLYLIIKLQNSRLAVPFGSL
jgi:hypothetical protein